MLSVGVQCCFGQQTGVISSAVVMAPHGEKFNAGTQRQPGGHGPMRRRRFRCSWSAAGVPGGVCGPGKNTTPTSAAPQHWEQSAPLAAATRTIEWRSISIWLVQGAWDRNLPVSWRGTMAVSKAGGMRTATRPGAIPFHGPDDHNKGAEGADFALPSSEGLCGLCHILVYFKHRYSSRVHQDKVQKRKGAIGMKGRRRRPRASHLRRPAAGLVQAKVR